MTNDPTGGDEKEVARRRDELLADARKAAESPRPGKVDGTDISAGSKLMGLGLQFVVVILVCVYAGMWLDGKLHSSPWFTLLGMVLGAGGGFYAMYKVILKEK